MFSEVHVGLLMRIIMLLVGTGVLQLNTHFSPSVSFQFYYQIINFSKGCFCFNLLFSTSLLLSARRKFL